MDTKMDTKMHEPDKQDTTCDVCGDLYDGDRPTTHRHCDGCGRVMSRREACVGSLCDGCYRKALDRGWA